MFVLPSGEEMGNFTVMIKHMAATRKDWLSQTILLRDICYIFGGDVAHASEDVAKLVVFVVEANAINVIAWTKQCFWSANYEYRRIGVNCLQLNQNTLVQNDLFLMSRDNGAQFSQPLTLAGELETQGVEVFKDCTHVGSSLRDISPQYL